MLPYVRSDCQSHTPKHSLYYNSGLFDTSMASITADPHVRSVARCIGVPAAAVLLSAPVLSPLFRAALPQCCFFCLLAIKKAPWADGWLNLC